MSKPVEATLIDIRGLAFGNLRFKVVIPHGKSKRNIELDLDAAVILRLADCIRGCQQNYEDPRTGDRPRDLKEAHADPRFLPTWIGHAVWHMEHPEDLMPCLPHGTKVIDGRIVDVGLLPEVKP